MQALTLLRIQARANRLANHRLHAAMSALTADELHLPRSAFFPTLLSTLNHVLVVDLYYIGVLHGDATLDIAQGVGHELHPSLIDSALHQLTHHIPHRTWRAAMGAAAELPRESPSAPSSD